MIKVIAFDFGGVLYTWDIAKLFLDLAKELKIASVSVAAAWNRSVPPFELGKIKERQFWKNFLGSLGVKHSAKKLNHIVLNQFKPINKNITLLKKLKKHYRIGLLSDHTDWIDNLERTYHFRKLFDSFVISNEVKIKKPDEKIFRLLIKKSDAKPKEIIFIDDRIEFKKPVEKTGMNFIFYNNYKKLIKDLRGFKIPP